MNDSEGFRGEENGFTNADILQWLRTFAAFILEFLNLISDIILLAFGMTGRLMSRFSCCSKCLSPDDMSVSDIEFSKITDSLRDLSIDDGDSTSATFEHSEDLVSVSSVESSRFESKTKKVRRIIKLKSRIPRRVPSCDNVSRSDNENASPKPIYDRYNWHRLSAMAPLYFIHEFNSFVREHNRRLNKTHLSEWYKKFYHYVHINEMKEQSKSLSAKEKTVLNAIREKTHDLVGKLFEFHKRKNQSMAMTLNAFHADLNFKSEKSVRKYLAESNGGCGDSPRKVAKESEDDDKSEVSTADEVYPTIEKVREDKKIYIGGGEIMQIITKHFITAKKKPAGDKSAPEHGRYPKIYPLPITPQDYVCRTVKTEYKIGKDVVELEPMYLEEHDCSPSPYKCILCQKNKERGYLSGEEVKAKMFQNSYSDLLKKVKKCESMLTTKSQVTELPTDEEKPSSVVTETPGTVSSPEITKTPFKGAQCHNTDGRIMKGLAQPRNTKTCPVRFEPFTYQEFGSPKFGKVKQCSTPIKVDKDNTVLVKDNTSLLKDNTSLLKDNTSLAKDNTPLVKDNTSLLIEPQAPVMDQQGPASGTHKGETVNNSSTRIITSAKRRLISKSVPPSMERRKADTQANMSPSSHLPNKHFPKDAWSIDGPTNEVKQKCSTPNTTNTNDCVMSTNLTEINFLLNNKHEHRFKPRPLLIRDEEFAPLEFVDTDKELPVEEPKEPVYQDIDATVDLSRNTVEPRYGESPNRKKLQAQMREKIKTKGEANKHLKAKQRFEKYKAAQGMSIADAYDCGDSAFKDDMGDADNANDEADLIPEEEEEAEEKPAEPAVVNAVEQPQTLDDREYSMIPEEILRKDNDKLKDVEEMYAVADKKDKRDKKKRKEKKNTKKKLTIPLTC